ncbi:MAG: hypothetical protein SGI86_04395 [Deltaproteobacteria bacterium]|nr:hypothetical protein [Deltaproteobacteria bacterium]
MKRSTHSCIFFALVLAGCEGVSVNVLDGPRTCGTPSPGDVSAQPADLFVNAFGIKPGGISAAEPLMKERLSELGVRQMVLPYGDDREDCRRLVNALGLKGLITIDVLADAMPALQFYGSAATAITLRNNLPIDATWGEGVRRNQQALFELVKGNDTTGSISVVGTNIQSDEQIRLAGDLSAWVDAGSFFPWRTELWRDPPGRRVQTDLPRHIPTYGTRRMVAPQTGYDTDPENGVSESIAGRYVVRTLLEHFRSGVQRTFIADFADNAPESPEIASSGIGILHNDGSPKPAFITLSRLMALIGDAGPAFVPGQLGYSLGTSSAAVHTILLQKRSGTFYLLLWLEIDSVETETVVPVTLELAVPAKALTVFRPAQASAPVLLSKGQRISVDVPDSLTVLQIERDCP